jgi:hypothetical protein
MEEKAKLQESIMKMKNTGENHIDYSQVLEEIEELENIYPNYDFNCRKNIVNTVEKCQKRIYTLQKRELEVKNKIEALQKEQSEINENITLSTATQRINQERVPIYKRMAKLLTTKKTMEQNCAINTDQRSQIYKKQAKVKRARDVKRLEKMLAEKF